MKVNMRSKGKVREKLGIARCLPYSRTQRARKPDSRGKVFKKRILPNGTNMTECN